MFDADGRPRTRGSRWFARTSWLYAALALVLLVAGCVGDEQAGVEGATVADGYALTVAAVGLDGPTQFLVVGDSVIVAEIGGEENGETGRLVAFASPAGETLEVSATARVLADGLDKPTGLALFDDQLWVMERNTLSSGPWLPTMSSDLRLEPVLEDMPFNGRSQGTLTPTPDGVMLFNTSGRLRNGEVVAGSGEVRSIDAGGTVTVVAGGLKHGYAHTVDDRGQLWVTELSDGTFDGQAAADELVAVSLGDDLGWPRCVGDNRPVEEFGGSAGVCADVPGSAAVFEPGATPTSVVVAPWDADQLLVALWVPGEVVSIDRTGRAPPTMVVSGLSGPQHLVVDGERVLLSEHQTGRILSLTRR